MRLVPTATAVRSGTVAGLHSGPTQSERDVTEMEPDEYDAFLRLLDESLETTEKLGRLFSRPTPTPFGKPFEVRVK